MSVVEPSRHVVLTLRPGLLHKSLLFIGGARDSATGDHIPNVYAVDIRCGVDERYTATLASHVIKDGEICMSDDRKRILKHHEICLLDGFEIQGGG